jgi:hypothetical protein
MCFQNEGIKVFNSPALEVKEISLNLKKFKPMIKAFFILNLFTYYKNFFKQNTDVSYIMPFKKFYCDILLMNVNIMYA